MPDDERELLDSRIPEVYSKIGDVLIVLADVGSGDYSARLSSDLPETHPLGALCTGINEMIAALGEKHARNEAYQRQIEEKLATIEQQREEIRALSTPVIEVWSGILCLPVVGALDSARSGQMMETLLGIVGAAGARGVIIDITGLDVLDGVTADHFLKMARAVQLLGAECVLTGVRPHVARAVVETGMDLGGLTTYRALRDGLRHLLRGPVARRTP